MSVDYVTGPLYPDVQTFDRANQIGRDNWRVTINANALKADVGLAVIYHHEREAWWNSEADTVKEKIGVEGLQVREQAITGGTRHDVVIDPTLSARLSECEQKASTHRSKADALERFESFLTLAGTTPLSLSASDAAFFELGQHSPGAEV